MSHRSGDTPSSGPPIRQQTEIALYDTTLRDGCQGQGVSFLVEEKLEVARHLDALGVDFIEGGWPGANPKDTEFFLRAAAGELELEHATLTAFGATRHAKNAPEQDPTLAALREARTGVACLVGKSWSYHVTEALGVSLDTNLEMVTSSIRHLRDAGQRVIFDAEHFFDGYRRDRAYAVDVAQAAVSAGAECVVLCDTNGGTMPWEVDAAVRAMVATLPCDVGVHFHDDGGCAVANSLTGVQAGASHVQGTANGLGERCGNANLFTVLANLQLKYGLRLVTAEQLASMTEMAHAIAELAGRSSEIGQPYVGRGAFAHKAGLHASALARSEDLYQHVDPGSVGNSSRILVSELAGRATVRLKARQFGIELDDKTAAAVLEEVKRREFSGYNFDVADASFELLVRTHVLPHGGPLLEVREVAGGERGTPCRVQVLVDGEPAAGVGRGDETALAVHDALRNAVAARWPGSRHVRLTDHEQRRIRRDGREHVRATLTASDDATTWTTTAVADTETDACADAAAQALLYHRLTMVGS